MVNVAERATVLNLRTYVPAVFIYEGNFGPAFGSLIINANGGIADIVSYISRFPHIKFRFDIGPNDTFVDKIPIDLKPFATFR